jgi:TolA-binding protein
VADAVAVPAPSVQSRHDRLAEEVAILSQAAKDLRAGRAANALSALNEHQKKFPNGLLAQERRAARAEALCSLGRYTEAQSELATLSRTAPQSPLTLQAQARCQARPKSR